ncbi:MAG: secondary thiamine-phosphate synthase enzyme YjbQ [Gammaproteobacteria bacterium]
MMHQKLTVSTDGRSLIDITGSVQAAVGKSGVIAGLCTLFIHHTSASLLITENADPDVLVDLERFMFRLVPDGDPLYSHTAEGPDDMPSHVRSVLTQTHLSIPVVDGRCDLGTWQGVFVWEHRHRPHSRRLTITVNE